MTIGWATIGVIWEKPILTVLVRPSRFSFSLLEAHPYFSVNVMDVEQFRPDLATCGTRSGREIDKVSECDFTTEPGERIPVPRIAQATLVYECVVIHKTSVIDADLSAEVGRRHYPGGDLHRIYHGEIKGTWQSGR